uniref:Uncharacterized protein n=1 Tax=Arundo donax TaxID=35708 RepID=A0A0A8YN91_ARUDO
MWHSREKHAVMSLQPSVSITQVAKYKKKHPALRRMKRSPPSLWNCSLDHHTPHSNHHQACVSWKHELLY